MSVAKSMSLPVVSPQPPAPRKNSDSTFLPHWGPLRRALHAFCKRSRTWNSVVAAVEMRLGREELISLPQYMSLCPTGQCNALCEFCSVTKSRSGIVKKQIAFDQLTGFTRQVSRTIQMYGLEGNGEPTLYDQFDDLVRALTAHGATFYLITNGERLKPEQIDQMLAHGIDAVNFSLNAATAETHRRVMKLKHFDTVTDNIRRFTQLRRGHRPVVAVSFVVTRDNLHEAQDFLRLAEYHLRVDEIYLRPLSELGNDAGVVEDVRGLVPYESEIADMLESVREYVEDVPRRSDLKIDPATFRSFRADPPGGLLQLSGFEDRLLPPRRAGWQTSSTNVQARWLLNRVSLTCPATARAGDVLTSDLIPVADARPLRFCCRARVRSGALTLRIADSTGNSLAFATIQATGQWHDFRLSFNPSAKNPVRILIASNGGPVEVEVDFLRVRTPPSLDRGFKLPHPRRWQVASPGASVSWDGNRVAVGWSGAPYLYLLKSFSVPCTPGQQYRLPIGVRVDSGELGIGLLGSAGQKWAKIFTFGPGDSDTELPVDTGAEQELQVVLFAATAAPLQASVDWRDNLDALPRYQSVALPANRLHASYDSSGMHIDPALPPQLAQLLVPKRLPLAAASPVSTVRSRKRQHQFPDHVRLALTASLFAPLLLFVPVLVVLRWMARRHPNKKATFYCQKPWTDMHNFTVDGRMDVCCIATGASQEQYALGNLSAQSFQEVWNGASMRRFRRTVNSEQPLPPCQRCPMAYGYQGGPLYNPAYARVWWYGRAEGLRWAPAVRCARWLADVVIDQVLFCQHKK